MCYLDVGTGVNLVDGVTRSSSSLAVQIIALDKHSVVTETAHPHVPLAFTLQLNTFTDVKPAGTKTQRVQLRGEDCGQQVLNIFGEAQTN